MTESGAAPRRIRRCLGGGQFYFEVEMKVQDDDLDEYGVVNNAVYASYIHRCISVQHGDNFGPVTALSFMRRSYCIHLLSLDVSGRDVMLESLGISVDYWVSTGRGMAISELNLKYFSPLRSGDRFVVRIRLAQIHGARLIMHHLIETLPERKLVLDAKATVVFLNKGYRPTRVFPEFEAKLRELFDYKEG